MAETEDLVAEIEALEEKLAEAKAAITRRFIGQERVVDLTLAALLCGGDARNCIRCYCAARGRLEPKRSITRLR